MDFADLVTKLLEGNTRAAARLISIVENNFTAAQNIIEQIYKHTGNAYILGITGAPGSGKSTFISTLTKLFVNEGKKIGIICVDPTSPLSGGAILGDRIRMKENYSLSNVFIRSMASRGQLGGLARATEDTIKILDAFGCDIIIVETVGVGQSEVDIFKSAQTVLVLLVPGLGDDIQAIKAGIMEITDVFVVNKMDLPGADKKVSEITQMLELNSNFEYDPSDVTSAYYKTKSWTPEIVKVNSKTGENFEELFEKIEKHKQFLNQEKIYSNYQEQRIKSETLQILKHKLTEKVEDLLHSNSKIDQYIRLVREKDISPYKMADLIIKLIGID